MRAILRIFAILKVSLQRILSQRGLALATALGLTAAIALTMSIPIYSDAVYQDILETTVQNDSGERSRPPFAFLYRYVGSWARPVEVEEVAPVDGYLSSSVREDLGLEAELFVRYLRTDTLMLLSQTAGSYDESLTLPLDFLYLGTLSGYAEHITLLEGSLPAPAQAGSPIDVLMMEARAAKLGVQTGEVYTLRAVIEEGTAKRRVDLPLRIAGVWKATDPEDPYWFYNKDEYNQTLLVPEETFKGVIAPALEGEVALGVWYWMMNPVGVQSAEVPGILGRIAGTRRKAEALLPKTRLDISPEEALTRYQKSAGSLTLFLYAFSIPLLLMTLTFISLVVNMAVGQRRNEIAILRSRGSTVAQLAGMALVESVLLGAAAMAIGTPMAGVIAEFFGRVKSFLDFTGSTRLPVQVSVGALRFGVAAALVAAAAQVLPTLGAASQTIVAYKQDRARAFGRPWWKRAWLDVLLLVPAGYGTWQLINSEGVSVPAGGGPLSNDPFQNPLLLLVPALTIFSLTLFLLRILPLMMRALAWLLARTRSVGMLMAARYLSRTAGGYSAPLVLLVMTLSLSTFTATMAQTLDRHVSDRSYYQVGARLHIRAQGEQQAGGIAALYQNETSATEEEAPAPWFFLPVSEHRKVAGIEAAARVGQTKVQLMTADGPEYVNYLGVDRIDFPQVAFWRRDFAPSPLGALMNDLGRTTEGVLVSSDLLAEQALKLGDSIQVKASTLGEEVSMDFRVVGVFDYFPTWYPSDGPLLVGNLETMFERVGGEFPYDVWVKTSPSANLDAVEQGLRKIYQRAPDMVYTPALVQSEQQRPERQGLFGLLSVGFGALALMTVIGFSLYALFSFQRRFVELGMLRAIGLSAWQMLTLLASELAFLFLTGLTAGTGLGAWVSNLFIPHLQVGSGAETRIPPFLVRIDWTAVYQVYGLFGILFLLALFGLGVMLLRMKIFQAIKMGEAV